MQIWDGPYHDREGSRCVRIPNSKERIELLLGVKNTPSFTWMVFERKIASYFSHPASRILLSKLDLRNISKLMYASNLVELVHPQEPAINPISLGAAVTASDC